MTDDDRTAGRRKFLGSALMWGGLAAGYGLSTEQDLELWDTHHSVLLRLGWRLDTGSP